MSSILVEKVKQKTIEEILPIWSEYLKNIDYSPFAQGTCVQRWRFEDEKGVEYKNPCKCLMGEFHNWNDDYNVEGNADFCQECRDMAMGGDRNDPPSIPRRVMTPQGRDQLINDIESHYNEVHLQR